jgi:hypothetical protein
MSLQDLPAISDLSIDGSPQRQISDLPDELLINIFSHLPAEHRMVIRSVSQKWNNIISDVGYHLEPLFVATDGMPHYSAKTPIRVNPAFIAINVMNVELGARYTEVLLSRRELSDTELLQRRSEFVTSPLTSMIGLMDIIQHVFPDGDSADLEAVSAVLKTATPVSKRSEGVRVGELLDLLDKAPASGKKVHGPARYCIHDSGTVWGLWRLEQKAMARSGIDVRGEQLEFCG